MELPFTAGLPRSLQSIFTNGAGFLFIAVNARLHKIRVEWWFEKPPACFVSINTATSDATIEHRRNLVTFNDFAHFFSLLNAIRIRFHNASLLYTEYH